MSVKLSGLQLLVARTGSQQSIHGSEVLILSRKATIICPLTMYHQFFSKTGYKKESRYTIEGRKAVAMPSNELGKSSYKRDAADIIQLSM